MPSYAREQLEAWLQTIEVKGSVIDVGGLHIPVKGRTKSWDVENYKILDIQEEFKGNVSDYRADINQIIKEFPEEFDNAFCLEVMEYVWNPVVALKNIWRFLKKGGKLYLSTHFIYPHHEGNEQDCLRYTRYGIEKLLILTGFKILHIVPRRTIDQNLLMDWFMRESKIAKYPDEIGHLITAEKA